MRFTRGIGLPTSAREWRLVGRTTRLVLSNPRYALVAVGTSILALTVFSLSQNVQFVLDVLGFEFLSPLDKLYILLDQFPLIGTTYDLAQSLLLVLVAILTGLNLTIALYHVREHGLDRQSGGVGTLGTVLGVLGAGCAACGSAVLAGVLSLFGASSALLVLPLDGLEVLLVAIVMLALSIYWLADGMRGGEINGCPVDL